MNAKTFFDRPTHIVRPGAPEWRFAIFKCLFGIALICAAITILPRHLMLAGWLGFVGLVFFFHLGVFHISSLGWRIGGVDVAVDYALADSGHVAE